MRQRVVHPKPPGSEVVFSAEGKDSEAADYFMAIKNFDETHVCAVKVDPTNHAATTNGAA
jgi:hypothetical protein